ncbi:GAP family protein [Kytococcus sp. Marseille-QA3725]
MGTGALAGLAGLALLDSPSFGTLVLPVIALLAHRRVGRRVVAHLAVIAAFYWALGVAMVLGGQQVLAHLGGWPPVLTDPLTWVVGGAALIGLSYVVDGTIPLPGPLAERARRSRAWMRHAIGPDAGPRTVVAVALAAGLAEVASMLPYLGAMGILLDSDLTGPARGAVLAGYCLLMVAPALALVALRTATGRWVDGPLERLGGWLDRNAGREAGWVVGIIGVVLLVQGIGRLSGAG